jgi:hypothetical protein
METSQQKYEIKMAIIFVSTILILFTMVFALIFIIPYRRTEPKQIQTDSTKVVIQQPDSIDYTCPHCGYNVRLTIKNN